MPTGCGLVLKGFDLKVWVHEQLPLKRISCGSSGVLYVVCCCIHSARRVVGMLEWEMFPVPAPHNLTSSTFGISSIPAPKLLCLHLLRSAYFYTCYTCSFSVPCLVTAIRLFPFNFSFSLRFSIFSSFLISVWVPTFSAHVIHIPVCSVSHYFTLISVSFVHAVFSLSTQITLLLTSQHPNCVCVTARRFPLQSDPSLLHAWPVPIVLCAKIRT